MNRTDLETGGWPFAAGEMARRVRAHDWAATPLGPVEQWPANLRTTVQLVLEHPFASIVLWGPNLIQIYNDRYRQLMGAKHPAGLGQPTRECWPEIWHINAPIYERVRRGESVSFDEAHYPFRRFGVVEDAWFTLSYSPVRDDAGAVAGVLLTIIESTRRVRAEQALRESEARVRHTAELLEQLLESAPDPIWTNDREGRMTTLNSATAAVLGRPREALMGWHNSEVRPTTVMATVEAENHRILNEGQTIRVEQTLFDASRGEPRVFFTVKAPLRSPDGHITGIVGIARDITDHKRAEEALRASEEFNRRVLQSSPDCMKVLSLDGRLEFFSDGGLCVMEVEDFDRQLRGVEWVSLWLPEDRPRVLAAINAAMAGDIGRFQAFCCTAKGTPKWWDVSVTAIRGADGRPQRLLSISRDITERKAAEDRLAELNATLEQQVRERTLELRTLLERAATAIIATDLSGRITVFNPAAEAMLRIPAREAIGRMEEDFRDQEEMRARLHAYPREVLENASELPDWLAQAARRALQAMPEGQEGSHSSEWTYVRADGTRVPGLTSISLLRDEQGQPTGFLAVITDLTERKVLEERLRERTRQAESANAAKTTFLANMSHEFRTPLNAVIGLSHLLAQMSLPERAAAFVRHIEQAGGQLLALVNDVLDLSKIEAGEMQLEAVPFDVPELLQQACALVEVAAAQKNLPLLLELTRGVPQRLTGDPIRLKQILVNLLGNAVKFTEEGSVTLRVARLALLEPGVQEPLPWTALCFEVTDTGIGIPPDKQAAVFQPFTQADGTITRRFGGTGLGLSIVQRLVEMMGGTLSVQSQPGQGSTFSVKLPFPMASAPSALRMQGHEVTSALPPQ